MGPSCLAKRKRLKLLVDFWSYPNRNRHRLSFRAIRPVFCVLFTLAAGRATSVRCRAFRFYLSAHEERVYRVLVSTGRGGKVSGWNDSVSHEAPGHVVITVRCSGFAGQGIGIGFERNTQHG